MRRVAPVIIIGLIFLVIIQGNPLRKSPNEKVVDHVKDRYKHAPWMKHVTDWGTTLSISVKTNYPPDKIDSYAAAYEICAAVKSEYAKDATDLPNLRIYGTDVTTEIKIDGSKDKETDDVAMAEATNLHDYRCGMTPPEGLLEEAKSYDVRVFD